MAEGWLNQGQSSVQRAVTAEPFWARETEASGSPVSAKLRVFSESQTSLVWKGPKDHLAIKDHLVKSSVTNNTTGTDLSC